MPRINMSAEDYYNNTMQKLIEANSVELKVILDNILVASNLGLFYIILDTALSETVNLILTKSKFTIEYNSAESTFADRISWSNSCCSS